MLSSRELSEYMKKCLKNVDEFTTRELKEMLKNEGLVYKKEYEVNAFSNAVATLKRKGYVDNDKKRKGKYKVISLENMNNENEENIIEDIDNKCLYETKSEKKELEEIRRKIVLSLKEEYREIEEILDSVKPSAFGENFQMYEEILELLKYLKTFKFSVE